MNEKLVPALLGGAMVGILSAIFASIPLPFVGFCCCLWAVGGGVLAVMMYVKKSPSPVSIGEGATIGAMAGVVGGVIFFVLFTIIMTIVGLASFEAQIAQSGVNMPLSGFVLLIIGSLMAAVFLAVLTAGGGALGVPIFEKRKGGGDAPPPPPAYGGDQPGGFTPGGGAGYGTGA